VYLAADGGTGGGAWSMASSGVRGGDEDKSQPQREDAVAHPDPTRTDRRNGRKGWVGGSGSGRQLGPGEEGARATVRELCSLVLQSKSACAYGHGNGLQISAYKGID